ncbi:MAG: hypothetical protein MZV64_09945 [Ignavibacteriales bacterium]|nr:hypothetical protein [Ignavibacteriales bacterium]
MKRLARENLASFIAVSRRVSARRNEASFEQIAVPCIYPFPACLGCHVGMKRHFKSAHDFSTGGFRRVLCASELKRRTAVDKKFIEINVPACLCVR